nr:PREDICTED: peroxisomal bifunctional enzyme isoform X1 [Lepisosteus oculatus]
MAVYTRIPGSVAVITLTNPPVNALSSTVRKAISQTVSRAGADSEVKAVVLCGDNRMFCAGADIREFSGTMSGPALVPLIDEIEGGEKPVVAAIEGVALGGGLELALGCHYRIAHSEARVGLPEVTLGLLPAAGGTQRLPRLTGIPAALELITTGRHVSAPEALKLGIVDKVTDGNVREVAVEFARSIAGHPLGPRRVSSWPVHCPPDLGRLLEEALTRIRQSSRGAMAPVACVQALRAAATLSFTQGMEMEKALMATLFNSGQARALQYLHFAQRAVGKWSMPSGACWHNTKPRPFHKAGVIGLGTMGKGIAVSLIRAGISVIAVEMGEKQLEVGRKAVNAMVERNARKLGKAPALALIDFTLNLQDLCDADLVIEAVFEDMNLKKQIFRELSSVCRPSALLCSNTSGLDIDEIASVTCRPELVVGTHFFAPAHVMKLLEVVRGSRTSPVTVATAMQLGKQLDKIGVLVGNCSGFVGNRMLRPYTEQAYFLLEEGARPEQVDQVLEEFGFAMGIFKMSDLSGLDVGWRVRKELGLTGLILPSGAAPRIRSGHRYSPLPDILCEKGRFGQKSGWGWYLYDKPGGRVATPDPWLETFLEEYRNIHGIRARRIDPQEILERCLYSLINEGFCILEEGIAAMPEDIDAIYVFGYSWPRHRGGPMFYASMVGLPRVLEKLEHYHQAHPDVPQLEPSGLLRKLVASGSPPIQQWGQVIKKHRSHL